MGVCYSVLFFFFKQKTAYEMRISDWSSDVCSSDLDGQRADRATVGTAIANERRASDTGNIEEVPHTPHQGEVGGNVFIDADIRIVVGVDMGAARHDGLVGLRFGFVTRPLTVELVKGIHPCSPFRTVVLDVDTGFGRPCIIGRDRKSVEEGKREVVVVNPGGI